LLLLFEISSCFLSFLHFFFYRLFPSLLISFSVEFAFCQDVSLPYSSFDEFYLARASAIQIFARTKFAHTIFHPVLVFLLVKDFVSQAYAITLMQILLKEPVVPSVIPSTKLQPHPYFPSPFESL
jgi:hypothetical protein